MRVEREDVAGVVLAAGAGTRLRPLTDERPKAMCPVGNVPLVDHALARVAPYAGSLAVNVHASQPTEVVIIASERIDEQQDWRMLDPGELIHVGPDLSFTSTLAIERPPAHLHLLDEADPNVDTF